MIDEKIQTFDQFLSENWFEKKWKQYQAGADKRTGKKLANIHKKLIDLENRAKQNKYNYEAQRFNHEAIKMRVLDAKRLITKLRFDKNTSDELRVEMDKLDKELDKFNNFAIEGLHKLMRNHSF